jgi:Protein of unknown function (DUF2865)
MQRHWLASAGLVAAAIAVVAFVARDTALITAPAQEISPTPTLTLADVDHKFLNDEWGASITSDRFWRSRSNSAPASAPSAPPPAKSRLQGPQPDASWFLQPPSKSSWGASQDAPKSSGRSVSGYRTVCVRMCDGFFFPLSFGASESSFGRDQATCSNSCPGSRLYYYKAGSEDPDDMVDTSGQAYSKLKNANLFRTQFVENCKCKPHPWEQEASDRHRIYALEDQRRKGNRAVVAELDELKAKNSPKAYGSNASRSRANDRNRRRLPAGEDQTSTSSETVVGVSNAPRSDSTRGQGGDRIITAALPSTPATAPATTGSIPTAPTAAAAATSRGQTEASSPSLSPIGRAAETASISAAAPSQQPASHGATNASVVASTDALETANATGDSPPPAQVSEPAKIDIPNPTAAVPLASATKPSSRRSRQAVAARPPGISYLGANARPSPAPAQAWRPARDATWTARIFQ